MAGFEANEQLRKLFIGGLSYKTTKETLHGYYERWGELVDSVVMQDKMTGKSRGFGFVTYRHGESLEKAMSERPHEVDGKRVDPKRAIPKEMGKDSGKMDAYASVKKIFVGGIRDKPVTEENLRSYFERFGEILDCVIMTDKTTQKSRGFAFVVFDDYDSVDKIVIQRFHVINGVNVEVKKAIPKEETGAAAAAAAAASTRALDYHQAGAGAAPMGSRAMPHYHASYPTGYGHAGWGSGAYYGTPFMSAQAHNLYGFPAYASSSSAPPFGGYNPRDLPTYGGMGQTSQRLANMSLSNAHASLTNAIPNSGSGGLGYGSNYYATERR